MKRFVTILAAFALAVACVVFISAPVEAANVVDGICGDDLRWTLDADGTLTISGNGEMYDYCYDEIGQYEELSGGPWSNTGVPIKKVIVKDGVTRIGRGAFAGCEELESVYIPASVQKFGSFAFHLCENLTEVYICDETAWEEADFESSTLIITALAPGIFWFDCYSSNPMLDVKGEQRATLYVHQWTGGDCVSQATCAYCGVSSGSNLHVWVDATCASPKFCFICGETVGDYGHIWAEATCLTAKTCTVCGEIEGEALGHSWKVASCTSPKTCTVCGTTEGTAAGHNWSAATCTNPKTCLSCGMTEGTVQHNWVEATCDAPKTCVVCGKTEGENQHKWVDATCTQPKYCAVCKTTVGTPAHTYDNASDMFCNLCGSQRVLTDAALKFYGNPGLSFQDYIGMQILVQNNVLSGYDKFYVQAVQTTPDGKVTTILDGTTYYGAYQLFEQKVVSWSMTEAVVLTLYGEKNGVVYQGATITATVKQLAMDKLATYKAQSNTKACRALVDMLNYGAAVQNFFGRNTDNLPNADLGDFAAFGSTGEPALVQSNAITGTASVPVLQDNISLQAKVELQLLFAVDISAYTPRATVNGKEIELLVDSETYGYLGWTLVRVAVSAANMRDTYTIALYDANGNAVTQIYNVSVEGYANARKTTDKHAIDVALMHYGDSVAALMG